MSRFFTVGGMIVLLGGCTLWGGGGEEEKATFRKIDYKRSATTDSLAIPPDLSAVNRDDELKVPDIAPIATATYSDYAKERSGPAATPGPRGAGVLPAPQNAALHREGNLRWLVVDGEAEAVWPRVRQFWLDNSFALKLDNPQIGILETEWAENRADIPQDFIRKSIGKAFDMVYSASTRDKFRVRVERGKQPGTTEIYLTHRGMQEAAQGDSFVWVPRPSEPELEAEMLNRLLVSLGIREERAKTIVAEGQTPVPAAPQRAQLAQQDGQASITLAEDFPQAWRLIGVALDRTGFTVEDRDRSQGIYYVRYVADQVGGEQSLLSKLAFWRDDKNMETRELRVAVAGEGAASRINVLDKAGQPAPAELAEQILKLLLENLNK